MVEVGIEGDEIVVHLSGWDSVWALTRRFAVPIDAVTAVGARSRRGLPSGIRLPGTYLPGVVMAGRYWWRAHGWSFWCVRRADTVLVIELDGHRYQRVVLESADPGATADQLGASLPRRLRPD